MPYASHIQLVNDANGTAYAFLVEDGAIWQCQWNSEAQRWDKGKIVPGAFGGEKVQALVLPEFWTTANNGGTTGTAWDPAIVLAYRVGQGSGAEIQASFGRWDAQGQLGWSAPVRLTDDQSSDRHFALSAGDNHTLNLVVEKQVGAAPANAVLDGLANAAANDPTSLREQLIAATQGSQPDSDLYVNRYRIDSTGSQLEQLVSTNVPGGQWQAITNEANPLKPASTPPQFSQPAVSLSGNTQLLRSLLYPAQQPLAQAALVAPASAEQQASAGSGVATLGSADPAPRGSSFSAAWAPSFLRFDVTGKFGALDLGLKGQNIFRWVYEVGGPNESVVSLNDRYLNERQVITLEFNPFTRGLAVVESKEFRELSRNLDQVTQGRIVDTAARAFNGRGNLTFSIANPSVSATSSWNLKLQGGLGQAQGGSSNLKSVSFAKFIIGRGNDTSQVKEGSAQLDQAYASVIASMNRRGHLRRGNLRREHLPLNYKPIGNINETVDKLNRNGTKLFISKTWNLGLGGTISSNYDYGSTDRAQLKSLATKEAVSIDYLHRSRSINGNWLGERVVNFSSGFYWQQTFTNPEGSLPAYAGYSGLAAGVVAAGLNGWGLYSGYKNPNGADNQISSTTYQKTAGALVALSGLATAAAVPLTLALANSSQPLQTRYSRGIQAQARLSVSKLYRGISGFDLNLADRFYIQDAYEQIGTDGSFFNKIVDQIYFDAGIRLIGDARIPLLTYYKDIVFRDDAAAQSGSGTSQGTTPPSGLSLDVDFTADGAYPLAYLPASGSPLFAGPPLISPDDARTFLLGDADVAALRLLTLRSAAAINSSAGSLQIQVDNPGAGLNPGQYQGIRILGVPLLAGGYATVDVTVNGQGQVSGLANLQGAEYLSLPEKNPLSGAFYLPLDLFQIDLLLGRSIASASALSAGTPTFRAPIFSLAASSNGSTGLTTQRLASFDRVAVVFGGAGYQRLNASLSGDPLTADQPATNDNAPYTYTGIPVSLWRDQSAVSLLGHDAAHPATATVHLAGGSIRRIDLDQPLYIPTEAAAADGVYSLGLVLPAGINPEIAASLSLTPSSIALNNLVEESDFSAEPGAVDTGVYIADSQANQLALVSSDGYKRLQNRVAYTSLDAKGKPFTVYLNTNSLDRAYASASDLSNEQIVNGTAPEFSFASHPTSISIAGAPNDLLRGDTLVVWVEAGNPLIPYSSENGNNNYQNYLTAAYGNQVLNYRVALNGSATNWQVPTGELYRPQNAIISDLQLFNVPDPRTGAERTLLSWAEISIDAIKGLRSEFGSGLSLPATIKATWINANPESGTIAWSDITEAVVSIPWDPETSVGMGIADLSIASQTIKLSDGTVLQTPLISWSQSVRTPYQQAVLKDQPTIYLPMAGLTAGVNSLNRGSASPSLSSTEASSRGLDFNVPGALAVEQTTAVRNLDGTGVLSTDLGSFNQIVVDLISQIPIDQLPQPPTPDPADPPQPSLPYAIECWVQLQPGSNPNGAGLVAFGQPSAVSVGSATLPQGWLLQSSFQVQRLSYGDAAALGLIETVPAGQEDGLYGWTWSLLADGANTTAMGGNGGTNLYGNALTLGNLGAGAKIDGVDAFLASYGLTAAQLPGLDNTLVNTMAMVPTSSLLLDQYIDPATQQPTSQLNALALDPATTLLNQGFVSAETAAANANLSTMLNRLWQYQEATGTPKVVFGLDPTPATVPAGASPDLSSPDPYSPEDYAGYALGFALWGGPSLSVNGSGQISFDVSKDLTITAPAGSDQRDGAWHYVAVSYAPTYTDYTVDGSTIQVPNDHGTAYLFLDGQLVASAQVSNPYLPFNPNGQALLLTNNAGGAIDHVAIYNAAINALDPNPAPNGLWPKLTATDALAELEALGLPSLAGAPDPGVIPGAVTSHWLSRQVNPAAALQATYTSSYRPDASGSGWAWSEASGLDPVLATVPTVPSASRAGSPAEAWTLSLSSSDWALLQSSATSSKGFNPSGQDLASVSVILSDSATGSSTTLRLSAEQVLVGNQTIAALQPRSTDPASRLDPAGPQLHYSVLNAAPALTLLVPRSELSSPATTTAKIELSFRSQDTARPDNVVVSTVTPIAFRELALASDFSSSGFVAGGLLEQLRNSQQALATAAVLESAPLQLKLIDSGLKFSSEASAAAANDPAASVPSQSFGAAQVAGTYRLAGDPAALERGWIAIAQTISADAATNLAGRVWINYTGQRPVMPAAPGNPVVPVQQAPITWLNALSKSNFDPETPNLPLLNDGKYPSGSGGLLIKADETLGIAANLGQVMLNADLNADGHDELIIAAPNAAGGGRVYIISGAWIASNLNTNPLTLDLANPTAYGPEVVTILQPGASSSNPSNPTKPDRVSFANFGAALAVDPSTGNLWIGAPQYVRELPRLAGQTDLEALVSIGALYNFDVRQAGGSSSLTLTPVLLGAGGELITPGADGAETRSYWGSQLGSAIAISDQGQLAVSAPGAPAAQEFYGTDELIQQAISGKSDASKRDTWGSLWGANFARKPSDPATISKLSGMDRKQLTNVAGSNWKPGSDNVKRLRDFIEANPKINIAQPTLLYNQALQGDAVGAVFVVDQAESLVALAADKELPPQLWPEDIASLGGATFYGSNVVNTLGATGFGSSLAFADLANLNSAQLLIGAASTGGTGAVLAIDPTPYLAGVPGVAIPAQPNSYLAYQAAFLNLLGANDLDQFGQRIVSLGDVNQDGYEDALITAPNSRDGAGSGYVVFGSDQWLLDTSNPAQLIGSVAPGSIGTLQGPNGPLQAPILEEIGYGTDGQAGAGSYGKADLDGDGIHDVLMGSGGNGSAYLTWGKPFLSAIDNLALEKLSSSNGFLLEGLASTTQGSLRSVGDFNADGYDDFISIQRGTALTTVRLQLGASIQELLSSYPYNFYSFTISNDTEVTPIGDCNGDGYADIALFISKTYTADSQGAGSSTGILYGRGSEKLPIGSGFGFLAPEGAPMPERNVVGGLTDAAPAFLTVGTTIYTAVKGVGNTDSVWFTQSRDGGSSWDNWANLTDLQNGLRTASGHGPALAWHDGRLVLGLLDAQGQISLSSWDPTSADLSQWTAPTQPTIDGQPIRSSQTPQLISGGLDLAVVWVDPDGHLQTSYSTDALGGGDWLPRTTLEERLADGSSAPIRSLTAPSLTPLGAGMVAMAIGGNDGSGTRIRVLTSTPTSLSWSEASSFEASAEALATGPSLALTDTGLALTYGTADQGVLLQRLNLLNLDGSSRNTAASTEQLIQQTWQATTLNGLSSGVGTVPLMVNGTLLLGNVRADAAQNSQIWLNAIAAPQDSDSTTWLDTTVQLPDGNGGWLVRQQAGADHPVAFGVLDPGWQQPNGGLSPWAPSFAALDGVLYSAVRGWSSTDNVKQLYWNRSYDNGVSWSPWQQLPSDMTSDRPPTIAAFDGSLYLVYIGQDKAHTLNITKLEDATNNRWAGQIPVRAGISGASNQTAEFATLLNEGDRLALYYVGTGENKLFSTSSKDPGNQNKFTTPTVIEYSNGIQTASGPLAATRVNGKTYLAYQGGTYTGTKSNTIYLTTGSVDDKNWSLLNGVPQAGSAQHTGVGLTANSKGLVLSYSDVVDGKNVVSLQQGSGSGDTWSFSTYSVLERPENSVARYDGANSLYAQIGNDRVLVSTIDSSANESITNAWAIPRPPTQVLTPEQTRSTLTPVGDLTGDGLADVLITAANVVQKGPGGSTPQLYTGVRLVSGAVNSAALTAANNAIATSQTLQLAPAFALDADPASTAPTAAAALDGLPQLTVAATALGERSRISTNAAHQNLVSFSASASDPTSLFSLFQGASQSTQSLSNPALWGKPQLRSNGFGDLNGDGRPDWLAADGLSRFQTANGELGYTLWDIRAAADTNGNGLDDVLLALVPQGPAYKPNADGSPSFIQPLLIDGALFDVDPSTNTFSLDRLKAPLNPYTQAEVFDLNSTSSNDYLPPLQAWINPILPFQPGTLTAAAVGATSQPRALSSSAPQLVVDELGNDYQLYTTSSSSGSVLANGLWIGYRNADDSWASSTIPLGGRTISAVTPTAAFYGGRLFVAYADQNGAIHISYTNVLERQSKPTQWTWNDYTVSVNGSPAKTLISPTLLVNHGLLNLIYPGDMTPDTALGMPQTGQKIYFASSNNPEAGGQSTWGASFDPATNRFGGAASVLQVQASGGQKQTAYTQGPVAATVFQGQTVLAYESMKPSDAIGVVLATEPLGTAPGGATPAYGLKTTSIKDVNGLSLTTDQAQLYLSHADSESSTSPQTNTISYYSTPYISAFAPTKAPGDPAALTWSEQPSHKVGNISILPSYITTGVSKDKTILDQTYPFPTSLSVAMRQGTLTSAWTGPVFGSLIQSGVLDTTITAPVQQSLAGYSIDGGIDNNGDGFADSLVSDPSDPAKAVNNQYVLFGGDWWNLATQVGTTGDDLMSGTPLADVIYTLTGADLVQSKGGADVILTADGDDVVAILDNRFLRIDAGSGFDQLQLEGLLNQSYDFRLDVASPEYFAGTKLQGFELISSLEYGANTLYFDLEAVNAFNDNRFLFLNPDAHDRIELSSEFQRNSNFDTAFAGLLWNAFAAGSAQDTPSGASPALVFVLNPEPTDPNWLSTHVGFRASAAAALAAPADALAPAVPASLPTRQGTTTSFGQGLQLTAFTTMPGATLARFAIERRDTSQRQVIAYASSSANSLAQPGRDYTAIAGLLVLEAGEARQEITVPLDTAALAALRRASLSLQVEELTDRGQRPLHLLIRPEAPAAPPAERPWAPPLLSGFELIPSADGGAASLRFRADTNGESSGRDHLQLVLSQRASASISSVLSSQSVALLDASVAEALAAQATLVAQADTAPAALALDKDQHDNGQVSTHLELSFTAGVGEALVSVLAGTIPVPLLFRQQDALAIHASRPDQAEGNSGSTAFTFTVTRHGESSGVSSASWSVKGIGTDPASGSDFVGGSYPTGSVSFAAGETSQTITINAAGEKMVERDESFLITLLDPSGATLDSSAAAASGIIRNDDLNQGPAIYQLSGTAVVDQTLTAQLTTSDPDGDGNPAFSWQTLSAGSWSPVGQAASYLITAADEGKPLRLLITYTDAMGSAETITIDAGTVPLMPNLAIAALTPLQSEGSIGSTSFGFQISRNGNLTGSTRVAWAVEASGANPANTADFALNQWPSGIAEFAPGQEHLTISIPVIGDGLLEPDESFRVSLSSASNGRIPRDSASATTLILNDDLPAQSFTYTASSSAVYEGSAVAIGIITTNVPSGTRLHWQVSGSGITATDFSGSGLNGEVAIGSDGRASFTLSIAADAVVENDEMLEMRFFLDSARSQLVGNILNITLKEPTVGQPTDGNDIITGTASGEQITGVPSDSSLRGRASRDDLIGGLGFDNFILGDSSGPYYNDGQPANRGTTDMAIIRDFAMGDRIQLWGDSSQYNLVSTLYNGIKGTRIDLLPPISGSLPEAIGFVQGATLASLNLTNTSQFSYITL